MKSRSPLRQYQRLPRWQFAPAHGSFPDWEHVLLGRWIRGLIFTACVIVMFVMGLAMNGKLYGTEFEIPLQIFALIANLGAGLPYLIASTWDLESA